MGSGSSKNKKKQSIRQPSPPVDIQDVDHQSRISSASESARPISNRPVTTSRKSPVSQRSTEPYSQGAANERNGDDFLRPEVGESDDELGVPNASSRLGYDGNRSQGAKSRSSARSVKVPSPPKPRSPSEKSRSYTGRRSQPSQATTFTNKREPVVGCPYCDHCQGSNRNRSSKASKPAWFVDHHENNHPSLQMDDYDAEAMRQKVIEERGRLPGCYDYRPHLTIDDGRNPLDTADDYTTQPFIVKTKPRVSPTHTPFPNFMELQRKEHRLNKPYSLPIFVD